MLGDDPAPTTSSPGPGKCSPPSPTSSTFATKPWPPPVSVDWKYSPSFVVHVALASAVISRRGGGGGELFPPGAGGVKGVGAQAERGENARSPVSHPPPTVAARGGRVPRGQRGLPPP